MNIMIKRGYGPFCIRTTSTLLAAVCLILVARLFNSAMLRPACFDQTRPNHRSESKHKSYKTYDKVGSINDHGNQYESLIIDRYLALIKHRDENFDYKAAMQKLNDEKVAADDPRLIKLIRNYYIWPPSMKDYNLTYPDIIDPSEGQAPFVDSRLKYKLISAYDQMKSTECVTDVGNAWDETGLIEDSENVGNTASVSCQVKPTVVSKQCQTKPRTTENKRTVVKMVSKGVQTEAVKTTTRDAFQLVKPEFFDKKPRHKRCDTTAEDFPVQSYLSPMKDDPNDPNYEPPSSPMSDGICSESAEEGIQETFSSVRPESERKFIVFEGNLLELFKTCRKCTNSTRGVVDYINGSLVKIRQICTTCLFEYVWFSQPFVGNKPAGNLMISAGILFSGLIPSKTIRMYSFNKIQTIGISSFINHQRYFLFPAIEHVWNNFQEDYFNDVVSQGKSIVVGGDGRADTPGHSAKFGNYTMMDLNEGIVIDIQLVQEGGFFVECGGLDGERASNTLLFERYRGWSGILVEADPLNFVKLVSKQRKAYAINACLNTKPYPSTVTFKQAAQLGRIADGKGQGRTTQVQCFPLYSILLALNQTNVDFFSLDIEGDELEVLETIPFDKVNITMMAVEYKHQKMGALKLRYFVERKGYETLVQMSKHTDWVNDLIFRRKGMKN